MNSPRLIEVESTINPRYRNTWLFYRKNFKSRVAKFNTSRQLPDYFGPMIGDKKEVTIAELGAGPFCTIGNSWNDIRVTIHASDILQNEFAPFWEAHKITPIVPIAYQDMERLTYPDHFFDIVHCSNALDHTLNPKRALAEMLRVCKPGGFIYLRHLPNQRTKYRGMHAWDANAVDGETIFSHPKEKFSLAEFGDFETHTEGDFIVSTLYKV